MHAPLSTHRARRASKEKNEPCLHVGHCSNVHRARRASKEKNEPCLHVGLWRNVHRARRASKEKNEPCLHVGLWRNVHRARRVSKENNVCSLVMRRALKRWALCLMRRAYEPGSVRFFPAKPEVNCQHNHHYANDYTNSRPPRLRLQFWYYLRCP